MAIHPQAIITISILSKFKAVTRFKPRSGVTELFIKDDILNIPKAGQIFVKNVFKFSIDKKGKLNIYFYAF